jgi:CRP/FNR family cyclic AMP-dependent transcriptional regulator
MPKATQQQDVAVLSSSKHGLVFLTANDWALIVDKATRMQFNPGESIVQQGRRTQGIYLVLKGTAVVQVPRSNGVVALVPSIGPGEVCGEISFLDDLPATGSVVVEEAVEACYLDRPTLLSLFELFPHLGSRFYRSLASSLSRRLREWIEPANSPKKK